MNKTVEKAIVSSTAGTGSKPTPADSPEHLQSTAGSGLTAAEIQSNKEEKLAAIRSAIEKGVYDTDAILEKALSRMLEQIEEPEIKQ